MWYIWIPVRGWKPKNRGIQIMKYYYEYEANMWYIWIPVRGLAVQKPRYKNYEILLWIRNQYVIYMSSGKRFGSQKTEVYRLWNIYSIDIWIRYDIQMAMFGLTIYTRKERLIHPWMKIYKNNESDSPHTLKIPWDYKRHE